MSVELTGVTFRRPGEFGDFRWMIERPEHSDALFIFNDNKEQFLAFRSDPRPPWACTEGGGNAVIRPCQCEDPPRAAGIPTGSAGRGFQGIDEHFTELIDRAIADIRELVGTGNYEKVFYSADDKGYIGTGIFDVGPENKVYITKSLLLATAPETERLTNPEISRKAARLASFVSMGIRMNDFGGPVEMEASWLDLDPEELERYD
ncbi:MAG TPA: hypothetical protein VMM38_03070 [Aridibacter sp.]|nr:hypothetical protein [Aridibacter sp.]